MKKKVVIVYQVSYETEIEIDTELPSGQYTPEEGCLNCEIIEDDYELHFEQIDDIINSVEVDNIVIPENEKSFYREQSFEITSFEIV